MLLDIIQLLERGIVPIKYGAKMQIKCVCGGTLLRNEKLTITRCSNKYCYMHMAYRGARMMKYLGVKGCAEETCKKMLINGGYKTHFKLMKDVFKDVKPSVFLWEIAKLACIDGYDGECNRIFGKYSSFKDYFDCNVRPPSEILEMKQELIDAEQYFDIKKPLMGIDMYIMIHGEISGFRNREDYVAYINSNCGNIIHVIEKGLGNDRSFLVTEDPNSGHRKNVRARNVGIPIVSPMEFEQRLLGLVAERLGIGQERFVEIMKGDD